ncbi:putative phosphate permease [Gracilariopsis chorda]|uniref:Phosphate transporter n=2 Tax=Gracilariopsis TaxID=2781 RepID=A0A2V3J6W7_9FLOR|nr:putative phosphate permease [Gracilariopsis chorda]|eukprot:PXF49120.1 putative phosphate permease [Gracilariopsis chorda]
MPQRTVAARRMPHAAIEATHGRRPRRRPAYLPHRPPVVSISVPDPLCPPKPKPDPASPMATAVHNIAFLPALPLARSTSPLPPPRALLRRSSFVQPARRIIRRLVSAPRPSPTLPPASPLPLRTVTSAAVLTPGLLVVAGGFVAFALSAALGANDVANSLGTSVGTGAIKVTTALYIGAVMEFAGAVLFGSTVTKTISSGVVTLSAATVAAPVSYMLGMLAVLFGCTVWMAVATKFGLPVSSTHSVVGALIGLGLVSSWGINYGAVQRIIASWFLSPLIGGVVATLLYKTISVAIVDAKRPAQATRRFLPVLAGAASFILTMFVLGKGVRFAQALTPDRVLYIALGVAFACSGVAGALATAIHSRQYIARKFALSSNGTLSTSERSSASISEQQEDVERIFKVLQVVTACLLSFSHGSNDVSNAIGPFAAMYSMWQNNGRLGATVIIPPWVLVLGGLGISTGLGLFGKPVMETVGKKITKLKPTMGFAVELSTALTVLIASEMGLPVSTTHTLIGCIVAIGLSNGDSKAVNKNTLASIAGSWGVTLPFSALVTVVFYIALRPFLPAVPALL